MQKTLLVRFTVKQPHFHSTTAGTSRNIRAPLLTSGFAAVLPSSFSPRPAVRVRRYSVPHQEKKKKKKFHKEKEPKKSSKSYILLRAKRVPKVRGPPGGSCRSQRRSKLRRCCRKGGEQSGCVSLGARRAQTRSTRPAQV